MRATLAGALVGLGMLPWITAPTITGWMLTLLASEFGHWLALAAVGVVALGFCGPRSRVTIGLGALAVVLLLSPAWRAAALARTVPDQMRHAFGESATTTETWSWSRLYFGAGLEAGVQVETHVYAQGADYELTLTVYRPVGQRAGLTGVVLVHSGGWDDGSRDELPEFSRWLTTQDAVVFAIDYRLAPQWTWPAPRDDTRAALHWVREYAGRFGVDPERLVLFGRSAGAQIALATAYDPASPPVRGVIAFYGPADLLFAYEHGREDDVLKSRGLVRAYLGGTPAQKPAAYVEASPIFQVRRELPPTLLVHGELDTLVWHRQSVRLDARLTEVGAHHYFLSLPWATHAFEFNLHGPGGQLACGAFRAFLAAIHAGDSPP